jgi:hypothetical protein
MTGRKSFRRRAAEKLAVETTANGGYKTYEEAFDAMAERAVERMNSLRSILAKEFPFARFSPVSKDTDDENWAWTFALTVDGHKKLPSSRTDFSLTMLDARVFDGDDGIGKVGFEFEAILVRTSGEHESVKLCGVQLYNYTPKVWVHFSDQAEIAQRLEDTLDAINIERFAHDCMKGERVRYFDPVRDCSFDARDILAWLNGRVLGTIVIATNRGPKVLWNVDDARDDGLTIEKAVEHFCNKNNIDIRAETKDGPKDRSDE